MTEDIPRLLLVITGIVALVVVSIGVKDYVEQRKEVKAAASISNATAVHSDAMTATRKKAASAKTKQARRSAASANWSATSQPTSNDLEQASRRQEFAEAEAKAVAAVDNAANAETAEAVRDKAETALDRDNRARTEFGAIAACIPLPNVTRPHDVDAAYYQNWAGEYSCMFRP